MTRYRVEVDPFTGCGAAFVIAGGLVAAVSRPLELAKGGWLAAYLVLVCGVALVAIGIGQQQTPDAVSGRIRTLQLGGWIVANALIVAGTLTSVQAVIAVGSALLLAVLLLTVWADRSLLRTRHLLAYAYLAVLVILAVSVPIGMVLAQR